MPEETALVTGATDAIGRAMAASLSAQGITVVMLSRNAESGAAAAKEINRQGSGRAEFMRVDLASLASVRETALRCLAKMEALDPEHARKAGRFFHRGREIEPPAYTRDQAVQQQLWEESARLAGLPV